MLVLATNTTLAHSSKIVHACKNNAFNVNNFLHSCRATEWPFWFGTIFPFVVVYILNWIMFIIIMVSICKHTRSIKKSKDDRSTLQSTRKNFTIAMTLAIVFGLGWAFGLTATSLPVKEITFIFQIFFCVLVGAQGVLLFFFHGVRNKDFRSFWRRLFHFIGHKTHLSYVFTSTKSSTAPESMQHAYGTDLPALSTLPKKKDITETSTPTSSTNEKDFNILSNQAYGSLSGRYTTAASFGQQPADYEEPHVYDSVTS